MSQYANYPFYKGWKANGVSPAVGYYLWTYESGSSLIPKTTYSDAALTTPNANPIVLNGAGEAAIFLDTGSYRFDLKTPAGALVNTFDPIQGGGASIDTVETIAELKTLPPQSNDTYVNVLGYFSAGDGGGGNFYWDATSVDVDDGGATIVPDSAPVLGRWKRLFPDNIIYAAQFGIFPGVNNGARFLIVLNYIDTVRNGGELRLNEVGTYQSELPLVTRTQDFKLSGCGWDLCRIKYTGTAFVDFITVGDGVTQCVGIQFENLTIGGGDYLAGKSRFLIRAEWFNSGCSINNVQLRDSVGMIWIQESFLSQINNLYCTTTTPTRTAAGISQGEWEQVHGDGVAPITILRGNAANINGIAGYRVGSEPSGGITPYGYMLLGCGGTGMANISIESCGTWTQGALTYNLRARYGFVFGGAVLEDDQFSGVIAGCYTENIYVTLAMAIAFSNSRLTINGLFWYNIWSDLRLFDNWGSGDMHIKNGDIYRCRAVELDHVLGTATAPSSGSNIIFENVHLEAGERQSNGALTGGAANLYNAQASGAPWTMGVQDATVLGNPELYPIRQTPKIGSGYAVTQGTNGTGDYIQVSSGYMTLTDGKRVSNMHATENNLRCWFWLSPDTASKYYRVYVGKCGQAFLYRFDAAPTEPTGNWIAQFDTNASNQIINLVSNPLVATSNYKGNYSYSGFITTYDTAAPTTGRWERGSVCWNTAHSEVTGVPIMWYCKTAGTPGTWIAIYNPLNVNSIFNLLGATGPVTTVAVSAGALTNTFNNSQPNSAGVLTESHRHQFQFAGISAGYIDIIKEEDFTVGANRTAGLIVTMRKDGTDTEYFRLSPIGDVVKVSNAYLQVERAAVGSLVTSFKSLATNDDPEEQMYQGRVATTDATVTTLLTIAIPVTTTVQIKAWVQARRTGGVAGTAEDGAGYEMLATYKNVAGTATLIGAATTVAAEDQAAWDSAFVVSGGNVLMRVTGAVNNNVTWHTTARVYKVGS